jgi:hypothetical protein
VFLFDPARSAFVHFIDAVAIAFCLFIAVVLQVTKSIEWAFNALAGLSLVLISVFLLTV